MLPLGVGQQNHSFKCREILVIIDRKHMEKHGKNIPTVPPHSVHFARAIARPWVSTLGRFGHILVEEGSGFFMRYCGSKWVDGKVFKNRVEN